MSCGEPGQHAAGAVIDRRYLLVTHIYTYVDEAGRYGTDMLWHKDLVEHLRYLKRFALACPVIRAWPADTRPFSDSDKNGATLDVIELPATQSVAGAVLALPRVVQRLWRAIGEAQIVHIGVGAGPIPHGWIAGPMARMRGKFLVVVVESAPWRAVKGARLGKRLRGVLTDWFARRLCNLATASFYTQDDYRHRYLRDSSHGYVNVASWIDEDVILTSDQAKAAWQLKPAPGAPLRVALFSRLVADKGVLVLLDAMKRVGERGVGVQLDIYGSGDLRSACEEAARTSTGSSAIRVCGSLPYDATFFAALRQYHAVLIPNLGDEQPRIVFDAFSQAVPCLASNTSGLRQCVTNGVNGRLFPADDSTAMAQMIEWAAGHRDELERLGLNSLAAARALTHRQMHRRRCTILVDELARDDARKQVRAR